MNHQHTTKPGRPALRILFPEDLEATFVDLLQGGDLKTAAVNLVLDWERIARKAHTVYFDAEQGGILPAAKERDVSP